jgi:putative transcriptional regulator
MIRILLLQRLDDKAFYEKRKISLNEVANETGIGRATLTRMLNKQGYSVGTDVVDRLCDYFDCEIGDLLVRVPDRKRIEF